LRLLTAILTISLLCSTAFAEKEGFSGYFDAGIIGISSNDALMVSSNNEEIDSLSENPDSFGKGILAVLFDVNYKSGSLNYHAGTPMESVKPELAFGVTKIFGKSSFDVSLTVSPMSEVWENPYVMDRDATDSHKAGLKFEYKGIAGTPFMASLKISSRDVKDDEIGKIYPDMKRDSNTTEMLVGYSLRHKTGFVRPFVSINTTDSDGEAESSDGAGAGVLAFHKTSSGLLIGGFSAQYSKYGKENPVFSETRKDTEASVFVNYKWQNPFGWQKKHISFLAGAMNRSSNIDFYDAVTYVGGVTLGFDF